MKCIRHILCVIGSALLLGLSWLVADANTNSVTIVRPSVYMGTAYPGVYQGVLVQISPAYPGLEGCSNAAGQYVFIDFSPQTSPNGRDLYAAVLAAFLAGHTVSFGTHGCTSDGAIPVVYGLNVDP
jgi:hypothetical protein